MSSEFSIEMAFPLLVMTMVPMREHFITCPFAHVTLTLHGWRSVNIPLFPPMVTVAPESITSVEVSPGLGAVATFRSRLHSDPSVSGSEVVCDSESYSSLCSGGFGSGLPVGICVGEWSPMGGLDLWADEGSPVGGVSEVSPMVDLAKASPMGDLSEPSPVGELVRSCVSPVGSLLLGESSWPSPVFSFGFGLLGVSLELPPLFPACSDMSLARRSSWFNFLDLVVFWAGLT